MKTFKVKSFPERKGLPSHVLARKETWPWACSGNRQLQNSVEQTTCLLCWSDEALLCHEFAEERCKLF